MADDKNQQDGRDRSQVAADEDYELTITPRSMGSAGTRRAT